MIEGPHYRRRAPAGHRAAGREGRDGGPGGDGL